MIYNHLFAMCAFDQGNNLFQILFLAGVSFVIPNTIIVLSYLKNYKKVKASKTKVQTHGGAETNASLSNASQQVLSRFLAYCFFMLLWMPPTCVSAIIVFVNVPLMWMMYLCNIVCICSSINPIIYGLFNTHFKKEYIKLGKKFTFKRKNAVHAQVSTTPGEATTRQSRV